MDKTDKKNKALPISDLLLDKHYPIAELYKKASSIQQINIQLKKCLDPSLHDHFELANINKDVATILVSSSSWATRLRYNIPAILNALTNQLNLNSIKTIRIKVNKIIPDTTTATPKKPIPLSQNTAKVLTDVANNFNDPQLRECFLKLSKNYHK
jgi:hypothetical protein